MQNYNILVVDDDTDIIEIISLYLVSSGYTVYTANKGKKALEIIENTHLDLIILDIMLPDFDGTRLCEEIRKVLYCPIIFISCVDEEEYILRALKLGGDDYITKPFNSKELIARVEANLRRIQYDRKLPQKSTKKIILNDLVIDDENHVIVIDNKDIYLSPIEFSILKYMINNPSRVLTYTELYENVWNQKSIGDTRTVMVHVSNLRKKLQSSANSPKYIKTIKKMGYKFG